MTILLTLPWPPSVNSYWRSFQGRVLIAASGRRYRMDVELVMRMSGHRGVGPSPVCVDIQAWFPDLRRRDIDNVLKAPLDALTTAGMWDDDSQIVALSIRRAGLDRARPRLEIMVEEIS